MADITGSQITGRGPGGDDDAPDAPAAASGRIQADLAATDDLLDEIDGLLETNAEEFVRSYVQKGGE